MYSFAPTVDLSDVHGGFYFMAGICILGALLIIWDALSDYDGLGWGHVIGLLFCFGIGAIAYNDSYTPNHPVNQQFTANFVRFQPEGYREQSGKTRSDRHYMYVVYEVNGQEIILQGVEGSTYPKQAVLYRN